MTELRNVNVHDGVGTAITSTSTNGSVGLDVNTIDSSNSRMVNMHFATQPATRLNTTTDGTVSTGDRLIPVTATTNAVVGDHVMISQGGVQESDYMVVTAVSAGVSITVNTPVDNDYTAGATVEEWNLNMGTADGSSTAVSFKIQPPTGKTWHILRQIHTLIATDSATPEAQDFGTVTALTNGMVLRSNISGVQRTMTFWQSNDDAIDDMYDFDPTELKGSANTYIQGRWTYEKAGVVIELDGDNGDYLEWLIQDAMAAKADELHIKVQGHEE